MVLHCNSRGTEKEQTLRIGGSGPADEAGPDTYVRLPFPGTRK